MATTINLNVKSRLYTAIVIPTAMYACETWKGTAMIVLRLDCFHRRCLHAILGISWSAHVTNEEVMLLFVWNTLTVSTTVSTTIPLHQDPLGVDATGLQGMQ